MSDITTDEEFESWVFDNINNDIDKIFIALAFKLARESGKSFRDSVQYAVDQYKYHFSGGVDE